MNCIDQDDESRIGCLIFLKTFLAKVELKEDPSCNFVKSEPYIKFEKLLGYGADGVADLYTVEIDSKKYNMYGKKL